MFKVHRQSNVFFIKIQKYFSCFFALFFYLFILFIFNNNRVKVVFMLNTDSIDFQ